MIYNASLVISGMLIAILDILCNILYFSKL